jgi:HD-like signal output (HDOD) protein
MIARNNTNCRKDPGPIVNYFRSKLFLVRTKAKPVSCRLCDIMYSPGQMAVFDSSRRLRARVLQTDSLPPIPQTLLRLLEVIQKEETSANELQDVILGDQNLAAKVLKVANSAYYGYCGKIGTVSRAVVAIGFEQVRNICLCALLMQQFRTDRNGQQDLLKLWQHSFTTAGLARLIVSLRPWIKTEEGYVMGLLHDLGRMVMMVSFPDDYMQVRKLAKESSISLYVAEEKYGMPHTVIGKWLAIKWHLPVVIQRVIEYHHDPSNTIEFHKEVRLVYLANLLANVDDSVDYSDDELLNECCRQLYISNDDWRVLIEKSIHINNESIKLVNMLK